MISRGQFSVLFILCRMFTLMTYVPLMGEGYSVYTQMAASLVSALILGLAALPCIFLFRNEPKRSAAESLCRKGIFIKAAGAIYILAALLISAAGSAHFLRFVLQVFFPGGSALLIAAVFLGVCAYASYLGIEAVGRTSGVVFIAFILMAVFAAGFSIPELRTERFAAEGIFEADGFLGALFEEIQRNGQILLLPLIGHKVKDGARKGFFIGLAGQVILLEMFSFMMPAVLGFRLRNTDYPFFLMIGSSGQGNFGRMDAAFIVIWTLSAVVYVGVFLAAAGMALKETFGFSKGNGACALTAYGITAAVLVLGEGAFDGLKLFSGGAIAAALCFLIPGLLLIGGKRSGKGGKISSCGGTGTGMRGNDRVRTR